MLWLWRSAVARSLVMDTLSCSVAKTCAHREICFTMHAFFGGEGGCICFLSKNLQWVFFLKENFVNQNIIIIICEPVKWTSAAGCLGGENMKCRWNASFVSAAAEGASAGWDGCSKKSALGAAPLQEGSHLCSAARQGKAPNPLVAKICLEQAGSAMVQLSALHLGFT